MSRQTVYIQPNGTLTARVMLRRPVITTDYDRQGPKFGPVLPKGAVLRIPLEPGGGSVLAPYGEVEFVEILLAAAQEPCPHLDHDQGEEGPAYYTCARFDYTGGELALCLGDKCRCPMEEVSAEAKPAPISSPLTETGGHAP